MEEIEKKKNQTTKIENSEEKKRHKRKRWKKKKEEEVEEEEVEEEEEEEDDEFVGGWREGTLATGRPIGPIPGGSVSAVVRMQHRLGAVLLPGIPLLPPTRLPDLLQASDPFLSLRNTPPTPQNITLVHNFNT